MKKVKPGQFAALILCACCLAANLQTLVFADDTGDSGTLDQPTSTVTPPSDLGLGAQSAPGQQPAAGSAGGAQNNSAATTAPSSGTAAAESNSPASTSSPASTIAPSATTSSGPGGAPHAKPQVKPVARPAASSAKPASSATASSGAVHGRIEELATTPGAILPLRALTPKLDTSKPSMLKGEVTENVAAGSTTLSGAAGQNKGVVRSFPVDYSGTWGGSLKVWNAQYGPLAWQFDPDEAKQELAILRPGAEGSVSFNFVQDNTGKVQVEPTQVVFTVNSAVSTSQLAGQMGAGGGQAQALAALLGGGQGTMVIPRMYAMHLGNLPGGIGVTGNYLQSRVAKNEIRELKPGVLEQTIVTRDSDTNSKNGKVRQAYSENVLRFTKISPSQLYVQVATVKYNVNGKFENKCIMYGTVNRGQMGMGGFPSLMGVPGQAGGGNMFGGLEQMINQMNRSLGGQ